MRVKNKDSVIINGFLKSCDKFAQQIKDGKIILNKTAKQIPIIKKNKKANSGVINSKY